MYERMLDKLAPPTFDDMLAFCGRTSPLWQELDTWLRKEQHAGTAIRFPYGNTYGWSVKYSKSKKHICDVFAEKGAFTAHFRISEAAIAPLLGTLDDYARDLWDHRYPCSGGGWLSFRVWDSTQLGALKKVLAAKLESV